MASREQILSKARGIVMSLSKMTAKEREQLPTLLFMEDYNKLRQLTLEADPDLEQVLPPEVKSIKSTYDIPVPNARYVELLAYAQQIQQLLSNESD